MRTMVLLVMLFGACLDRPADSVASSSSVLVTQGVTSTATPQRSYPPPSSSAPSTAVARSITLAGPAFVAADPAHPVNYTFGTALGAGDRGIPFEVRASLPVTVGDTLMAIRVTVTDSPDGLSGPTQLHAQLIRQRASGGQVLADSEATLGNGCTQVIVMPLSQVIAAGAA